jgi:hypothetical protein
MIKREMSNCTAPPITRENAAEFQLRGVAAKKAKREHELLELKAYRALERDERSPDVRTKRVLKQIKRCDDLLDECEPADFPALTAAKERLWNLVFPKAGVMRPKANTQRRSAPTVEPTPQEPAAEAVPPAS